MKTPLSLKGRALALLAQREQSELELRRKLMRHARAEAANAERAEAVGSTDRDGTADSAERFERTGRTDRTKCTDRSDRSDRTGRAGSTDRAERPGIADRTARADRSERTERTERVAESDESARSERSDRAGRSLLVASRIDEVIGWLRAHDYLSESRFVESRVHARASRFGNSRIQRELAQHGVSLARDEVVALRATEADRAAQVWQRKFAEAPADRTEQARQIRFLMARGFPSDIVRRLTRLAECADRAESGDDPLHD